MRTGLSKSLIARILGAAPKYTIAELEEKFPPRFPVPQVPVNLGGKTMKFEDNRVNFRPDGPDFSVAKDQAEVVTRFAPSPTGLYHLGNLYQNIIAENLAHCSSEGRARGIFYLRIEDTDTKREVPGAVDTLVSSMAKFGFKVDEGQVSDDVEIGEYGPYTQSARKDIYHSVASQLLADGRAYPCFLTAEEMDEIREKQKAAGFPTGIYGSFARDRDLTEDEIIAHLDAGGIPSVRLYSTGDPSRKIYCKDAMRGSVEFPENNSDEVIIKSNDGLPTYHFAHLVDDHFMRTTHVVRAIEWLPSLPLHVQMFQMMGWDLPVYIHHATVDTLDAETGNRRKLSKRKDRVAAFQNLWIDGWAPEVFLEYIFNLIVSGYEDAKMKNPALTIWDYPIKIKKLPVSGALFDMKKMEWWAREFIATLDESKYEITERVMDWAREYSPEWYARIKDDKEYLHATLNIERDPPSPCISGATSNPKRIRKDFVTWKQTLEEVAYFWDDKFSPLLGGSAAKGGEGGLGQEFGKSLPPSPIADTPLQGRGESVLSEFLNAFDIADDKDTWWNKIVKIASDLGMKNGDVAMALRVAITGRTNTPDLYSIMQVMGAERVRKRVENVLNRKEVQ